MVGTLTYPGSSGHRCSKSFSMRTLSLLTFPRSSHLISIQWSSLRPSEFRGWDLGGCVMLGTYPQPEWPLRTSGAYSLRVLCETVKDFVARVGKAYERATESSEESEDMAKKVGLRDSWAGLGAELHTNLSLLCLLSSALF